MGYTHLPRFMGFIEKYGKFQLNIDSSDYLMKREGTTDIIKLLWNEKLTKQARKHADSLFYWNSSIKFFSLTTMPYSFPLTKSKFSATSALLIST